MNRIVLVGSLCFMVTFGLAQSPSPEGPSPDDVDPFLALYVPKATADAAAALVKVGDTLRDYCGYCREKEPGYTTHVVETVTVEQDDESDKFALVVNGVDVDLASTHILMGKEWKNLAVQVNADVKDVPAVLSPDVTELKEGSGDEEVVEESAPAASPSPAGN